MKKNDAVRRQEHELVRNKVAVYDFPLGINGVVEFTGEGARQFLDELCVNNIRGLKPGKIKYTSILNEDAIMLDDVTVYCFSDDRFWMVPTFVEKTMTWISSHQSKYNVKIDDLSKKIFLVTVQGPESRRVLASYLKDDMTNLPFFNFMENSANGYPVIVSRTGFTGELGYEIYIDIEKVPGLKSDLIKAGKRFGMKELTTDVKLDSLVQEKGLIRLRDFGTSNPLEIGLDNTIDWEKPFFIGKAKLEEARKAGLKRRLMGYIADNDEIDIALESPASIDGKAVGKVTSACYGYSVNKSIGYCLIEAAFSEPGTRIEIDSNGTKVGATITERMFYDKERVKITAAPKPAVITQKSTRDYISRRDYKSEIEEKDFHGVYAAMPTPFTKDEHLDVNALPALIEYLIAGGLHGILLGGTSGEYPMMDLEDRKLLFKTAADINKGRIKLCACCSTNAERWTRELIEYSGDVGMDFALITPPFDMKTTIPAAVQLYRDYAKASKPGVVIYHFPAYTNVTIPDAEIASLAKEPNIKGIKNVHNFVSGMNIVHATQGENFGVINGHDDIFYAGLAVGGHGMMGVGGSVAPKLCREMYDSFMAGEINKAQEINERLMKIINTIFSVPFPAGLKAAVELQGIPVGRPMKPHVVLDENQKKKIQNVLIETGVMSK